MAECLSQSLAGASLSPDTIKAVASAIAIGLACVGPEFFRDGCATNSDTRLHVDHPAAAALTIFPKPGDDRGE